MVGEGTTKCAEMALKLHTVHRWNVSGTPLGRSSIEDLFGLLLFLQLKPYSDRQWWRRCVSDPWAESAVVSSANTSPTSSPALQRLCALMSRIMWRNSKRSVQSQLGIPPQTSTMTILRFSGVEQFLYNRRHEVYRAPIFSPFCHRPITNRVSFGV